MNEKVRSWHLKHPHLTALWLKHPWIPGVAVVMVCSLIVIARFTVMANSMPRGIVSGFLVKNLHIFAVLFSLFGFKGIIDFIKDPKGYRKRQKDRISKLTE